MTAGEIEAMAARLESEPPASPADRRTPLERKQDEWFATGRAQQAGNQCLPCLLEELE